MSDKSKRPRDEGLQVALKRARVMGVAWFRREDYERIREISDDEMIPTFDEWEAKMNKRLPAFAAEGVTLEKVIVDPEDLLAFARGVFGGKINTNVRSAYAGMIVAKKYGTNH